MCLAGCTSDSGNETASQSAPPETTTPPSAGTGTSNGGATATCEPFVITSETVATTPGARTRTRIGIGEEVDLATDPVTTVTWTIVSDNGQKGTLSTASGSTSQYTACDRAKSVTIKAESACGRTDTQTFTVVEPSDGRFTAETDVSAITPPTIKVGFQAAPGIMPNDVSFYNCDLREGVCAAITSGVFLRTPPPNHADTGRWLPLTSTVGPDGTEFSGHDTVTGTRLLSQFPQNGTTDGLFHWPIPWRLQVRGGGTNGGLVFDTVDHELTYTASTRLMKMQKANRSAQLTVPQLSVP